MHIVKTNTYYVSGVDDIYAFKSGGVFLYLIEPRDDLLVVVQLATTIKFVHCDYSQPCGIGELFFELFFCFLQKHRTNICAFVN